MKNRVNNKVRSWLFWGVKIHTKALKKAKVKKKYGDNHVALHCD